MNWLLLDIQMWIICLVFFLLGLLLGWLLWGALKKAHAALAAEHSGCKTRISTLQSDLDSARASLKAGEAELASLRGKAGSAEGVAQKKHDELEAELRKAQDQLRSIRTEYEGKVNARAKEADVATKAKALLESDNKGKTAEIERLRSELSAATSRASSAESEARRLQLQLDEARAGRLQKANIAFNVPEGRKIASPESSFTKVQNELAALPKEPARPAPMPVPSASLAPAAAPAAPAPAPTLFPLSAELTGAEEDPDLGLVFRKRPGEVDDLEAIKGVGPVILQKLHDFGVYRFKQIALWSPERIQTFADRLEVFKDRIGREEWVAQAKQMHAEKYGEVI